MIKSGSKIIYGDTTYTVIRRDGNAYICKRQGTKSEITVPVAGAKEVINEGRQEIKGQKLNG